MPLFSCAKCQCVENTASANYWQSDKAAALCSECDPEIGQWHGLFPKKSAVGYLIDQNGFLWAPELVAAGQLPPNYRIVGEVLAHGPDSAPAPDIITKVRQQGLSDCGVACLAMIKGCSYDAAKRTFDAVGLSVQRGRKAAYATTFTELTDALAAAGIAAQRRRFIDWGRITGKCIIKTNVDASRNWHWVVAYRAPEGIVLLDPAVELPCFESPPLDVFYVPLSKYSPAGCYLQIEQPTAMSG